MTSTIAMATLSICMDKEKPSQYLKQTSSYCEHVLSNMYRYAWKFKVVEESINIH